MSISEPLAPPCPFERGVDTAFLMQCGATRPQRGPLALGAASPPRCHSYTSRPTITTLYSRRGFGREGRGAEERAHRARPDTYSTHAIAATSQAESHIHDAARHAATGSSGAGVS